MVVRWDCIHFPEVLVRLQLVTRPFWSYTLVLLVIVIFSSFFLPPLGFTYFSLPGSLEAARLRRGSKGRRKTFHTTALLSVTVNSLFNNSLIVITGKVSTDPFQRSLEWLPWITLHPSALGDSLFYLIGLSRPFVSR